MLDILCLVKEPEKAAIRKTVKRSIFDGAELCFCADAGELYENLSRPWDCLIFDGELFSPKELREAEKRLGDSVIPEAIAILSGNIIEKFKKYSWGFDITFLIKPISGQFLLRRLSCAARASHSWEQLPLEIQYKITLEWDRPTRLRQIWIDALHITTTPSSDIDTAWLRWKYRECGLGEFPEQLCPMVVTILDWDIFSSKRVQNAVINALDQVICMHIPEPERAVVFEQYSSTMLILLNPRRKPRQEELKAACEAIIDKALAECGVHLFAMYGSSTATDKMSDMIMRITSSCKNSISRQSAALPIDAPVSTSGSLPDTKRLCDLIVGGYRDRAKKLIREQIYMLPSQFKINSDYIFAYQLRLLQDLFTAISAGGLDAGDIFLRRREFLDMFDVAGRSQLNLISWVCWLTDTVCDKLTTDPPDSSIVERVRRYAENNLDGDLSRSAIAAALHLSESRLSHQFSEQAGMSLTQYLTSLRIEQAQSLLLSTEIPIAQISAACGFSNSSYFAKAFAATAGCTPLQYRKRFREEEEK